MNHPKKNLLRCLPVLGVWLTCVCAAPSKPNIIVIFTDDHGYADLSCAGHEPDVRTPNLDRLAAEGVRFTDGYVTAPQCCPSRGGLLTGRDQNRFGFGANGKGPLPLDEVTLAYRLGRAGYVTGMVGKWHLDVMRGGGKSSNHQPYHPCARGFQEAFYGNINSYSATYDLEGNRFDKPRAVRSQGDRIDRQSDAALRFIDMHHDQPFFLYLAYFAPHVPLASSKKYLDRFPGKMPERRRLALAMISAVDDGVGRIMERLARHGIDDRTLVFFISDNGAPLKLTMEDITLEEKGGAWDGSKNTPLNGEKGMLAVGGIRVPFLARWKGTIPGGQVCGTPVSSLDVAATACTMAGLERPGILDGRDLLPMLRDGRSLTQRALFWRFWNQAAVREGDWKLLKLGSRKTFLFNLARDPGEHHDVLGEQPEIATRLGKLLGEWAAELEPAGLPEGDGNLQETFFYHHFFRLPLPAGVKAGANPFVR